MATVDWIEGISPVVRRIYEWVEAQPGTPAVEHREDSLTYGELWSWASVVATEIRRLGNGSVVGILRNRDMEVIVSELACWIAGVGYLPLDPSLPAARIARLLGEARCPLVYTDDTLLGLVPEGVRSFRVPRPTAPQVAKPGPLTSELAYVIFTSGSTGSPKGVAVGHASLDRLLQSYAGTFRLGPTDRVAMLAHLAFDCLILDIWGALYSGSTIVIPPQKPETPEELTSFLYDKGIQHLFVGTSFLERLILSGLRPVGLRSLITAGEPLRVWPPADFPAAVFNGYGPTEATVIVTLTEDLRTYASRDRLPPIGRPLEGANVWLEDSESIPIGSADVAGELIIGESYLALGYVNRADLTRLSFPDAPDGRSYRTGDICFRDSEGEYHFLHRLDRQVKLHGVRVELAEIEEVLLRCAGVRQAAVEVSSGDEKVVHAWIEGEVPEGEIREFAATELPSYMRPHVYGFLERMPLTTNGKIDRMRLSADD